MCRTSLVLVAALAAALLVPASASALECTATVGMAISRQVRITRSAISPRFAIKTFLNKTPGSL